MTYEEKCNTLDSVQRVIHLMVALKLWDSMNGSYVTSAAHCARVFNLDPNEFTRFRG